MSQVQSQVKQILGNPNPQVFAEIQGQKIAQLQSELLLAETRLEDVARYALALEQKLDEVLTEKEQAEVETVEAVAELVE